MAMDKKKVPLRKHTKQKSKMENDRVKKRLTYVSTIRAIGSDHCSADTAKYLRLFESKR